MSHVSRSRRVGNRARSDVAAWAKSHRKSGLPDLRIIDADLGQARDRCGCPRGIACDFAYPTRHRGEA